MALVLRTSCGMILYRMTDGGPNRLFLILRRCGSTTWEFPKGGVKPGEDELACARREIEEECGIHRFELHRGFRDTIHYQKVRAGVRIAKRVVFFLARVNDGSVALSEEHEAYLWATAGELFGYLKRDSQRRILETALEYLQADQVGENPDRQSAPTGST